MMWTIRKKSRWFAFWLGLLLTAAFAVPSHAQRRIEQIPAAGFIEQIMALRRKTKTVWSREEPGTV